MNFWFLKGAIYNLKKLLHGTTGYLNQIDQQIFSSKCIQKEIKSEKFKSSVLYQFNSKHFHLGETSYSELLGTRISRNLTQLEITLFRANFKLNLESAVTGDRAKFQGRIFHSIKYSRKGNLNSYTVSYIKNGKKKFGKIEYFIEKNENFYAFIKKLKIKEDLALPKSSGVFDEFIHGDLMKSYYKLLVKTSDFFFDFINCKSIEKRCLIVSNEKNDFITEISYEYEHD